LLCLQPGLVALRGLVIRAATHKARHYCRQCWEVVEGGWVDEWTWRVVIHWSQEQP
jgi:hypothetical protein